MKKTDRTDEIKKLKDAESLGIMKKRHCETNSYTKQVDKYQNWISKK